MADKKISALTSATTPLAGTEVLPIVQSSTTVKVPVSDLTAGRTVLGTIFSANISNPGSYAFNGAVNLVGGDTTGNSTWTLVSSTTGIGYLSFADGTSGAARYAGRIDYNHSTNSMGFYTNGGVEAQVIDSSQNVKFSVGNLVQGTAAKGVNFTANTPAAGMTSQLLNWYEEGVWSPILSDGTNNATMSTSTQGHYTRIGNTVFYRARVRLTSLGSVSGSVRVTGLPFTVTNVESNYGGGSTIGFAADLNITAGYAVSQIPINTTTYISLYLWDATTGPTALQASEMTNTSDIYFSGQYQI